MRLSTFLPDPTTRMSNKHLKLTSCKPLLLASLLYLFHPTVSPVLAEGTSILPVVQEKTLAFIFDSFSHIHSFSRFCSENNLESDQIIHLCLHLYHHLSASCTSLPTGLLLPSPSVVHPRPSILTNPETLLCSVCPGAPIVLTKSPSA